MDPATLLARLRELCPLAEPAAVPGSGFWTEDLFWQIVQHNAPAAAELLAAHASRADFGNYGVAVYRSETRVYQSTVATRLARGTWFDMACLLARKAQTHVCATVAYILREHPGLLRPCNGVELFLRLYVEPTAAQEYAVKILTALPYPWITEAFIDVCGDILCPPYEILRRTGLCDAPIVCVACAKSPGSCRLYALKDRVTKTELFDVCATHGLTLLALECIAETAPNETTVVQMFRNAICAAARCDVYVWLVIRRALDGLQGQIDESRLLDCTMDKNMIKQVGAPVLIAFVREMSFRQSWNLANFMVKIVRTFQQHRGRTHTAQFIRDHLLPFLTTRQPVASLDHPPSMRRMIQRVDADHMLARVLQHTGPLVGPAVHALFCTLDHVIVTME
jgi:hypothetical protein